MMVLGNLATETILTRAKEAHLARIRAIEIEWQLVEYIIVKHYLLKPQRLLPDGDPAGAGVPDEWNFTKWEYFHNPTGTGPLQREHSLQPTEVAALRAEHTGHRKIELFRGAFPTKTVGDMEKDVVYMSTTHVMPVGEAFTVCEESGRLTLYQCSTVKPKQHAFRIQALQEWVDKVKPTQLSIIYFTDWSERSMSRITVVDDSYEFPNDDEVSMRLFHEKGRFQTYIVRCGIYRDLPAVMLGSTAIPEFSEWHQKYEAAKRKGGEVSFSFCGCFSPAC
jgi:hypothetical protein